jgi:serine/threonine protein kinase
MTSPKQDWKRLLGLMESYLELNEHERPAWVARLGATDPKLKSALLQLLMQHNSLLEQNFLATPVARAAARSAASSADGLGTLAGSRPLVAAYTDQSDDDATVVPWRRDDKARSAGEVMRVSGEWATRGGDDTGPPATPSVATPQPPASMVGRSADMNETGVRDPTPPPTSPPATPPSGTRPLEEGDVLDGRYTLVAELGRGGMGTVYKALDANRVAFQDRHPYIALKLLGEEFKRHPDALMALQRETVRAQGLTHENIVRVHDFDYDGTYAYMTMELLEGRTLEDWLQDESSVNAPLERRWSIVCGIGAGLSCAHKNGVVHSDLKPGNIFLCKNGGVKVMDFGIARPLRAVTDEADTTRFDAAERLGALTPAYASLEQMNYEPPDPRDDIYAFACVVYYLFSGRHPFGRESAKKAFETHITPQRISSLTRLQWETLRRALAFKRSDRIATIDEFLRQFAPRTWWHKHRALIGAAALAVAGTALFFGTQYYNDYVEDQAMNAQLWPSTDGPAPQLTADQRRDIDDYLYLSKEALNQAAHSRSPEEMAAILSRGDNNLLDLLHRVRSLEPANPQALGITDAATHLYADRVRALLAAHKLEDALRFLSEGQSFRHTHELFRLKRQLCDNSPTLCARPGGSPAG